MFRPQIQKTKVMLSLAILIMVMVYWSVNSYVKKPTYGYDIKKRAIKLMIDSIEEIRNEFVSRNINNGKDTTSYGSFLIGPKESIIQTTNGSLNSKLAVLNPDFAAMIVEMFMELNLNNKDTVAVSYTGSYPGANIAILSALEAMNIYAIMISSCGSSEYGATYPSFTWIDMEAFLNKSFSNHSTLASIGGGSDLGGQLGTQGRRTCEASIYNNKIELLNIDNALENIENRITHYTENSQISAFINIGGGVYSTGDSLKRNSLSPGIIYPDDILAENNIETVIDKFLDMDIPVINLNHINKLSVWYDLPYPPNLNHKHGVGSLFYLIKPYNPIVIIIALIISAGTVFAIGVISHNEIKKRMYSSEPESFI